MNVVSAYLVSELEEKIYMKPSKDLSYTEKSKRMTCCLVKGLYSLKQSEKVWNNTFWATLTSLDFVRLLSDNSVFLNWNSRVIIALYVENLLIFTKKLEAVLNIKKELQKVYNMKDLRETNVCLSIQICWDWKNWTLTVRGWSTSNIIVVWTGCHRQYSHNRANIYAYMEIICLPLFFKTDHWGSRFLNLLAKSFDSMSRR